MHLHVVGYVGYDFLFSKAYFLFSYKLMWTIPYQYNRGHGIILSHSPDEGKYIYTFILA